MSLALVVNIEYRKPRSKDEAKVFGRTSITGNKHIATIFINSTKQRDGEALNTFFHEVTHIWHQMLGITTPTRRDDEHSAQMVGDTVEALLKRYFRR